MTVYGLVYKPKRERVRKRELLRIYFQEYEMWEKEDFEIIDDLEINKYSHGDTILLVGLKDLYYLGLSNTLRDLLEKGINIRIIPMKKLQ